jgi:hypothetical protein
LQDRIEFGFLAAIDVEDVIGNLASALEFVHSRGLVHGNLKPSNILFDEEGNVQLNGLGESVLRRFYGRQRKSSEEVSYEYQAPEVRAGGDITPMADQYSLGVIMLQMMTNLPIEVALSGLNMLKSHGSDRVSRTSPFVLDLPKRMIAVLLQALSGDPSQRFPSIRVMHQAFVAALRNQDFRLETELESSSKKKPPVPEKRKRSRLLVFAPMVALALLLVVVLPTLSFGSDGLLGDLMSFFGIGKEENALEVAMGMDESGGGIDLGEVTVVKSPVAVNTSIHAIGIVATPTAIVLPGDVVVNPPDAQASPAKIDPRNMPTSTPSSPDQPTEADVNVITETATPTPTEELVFTPTFSPSETTIPPTPTPKCKFNAPPNNPNACPPTPTPQ